MNDLVNGADGAVETAGPVDVTALEPAAELVAAKDAYEAVADILYVGTALQPLPTDAAKRQALQVVYLTWRNTHLSGLPVDSFNMIDSASGALLDLIAAL